MFVRFSSPLAVVLCCVASPVVLADWPSWRGPKNLGSIETGKYPSEISEDTIVWKAALPGKGCSTPITTKNRIFVTAPINGKDSLLCFDWNGKQSWNVTFGAESGGKHRNGSGCNASPVTDGDAVYVYFKSGTIAAVNLDGSIRWQTNLIERFGDVKLFWDHGTSPVLTQDHVVMARMHGDESWLVAFDKKSGKLAWKIDRTYQVPVENDHGYASPLVIDHNGSESILVWGAEHITIHDSSDGHVVWSCGGFNPDGDKLWPSIAMPVIIDQHVVICYGRNDKGKPRMYGVDLSGNGDTTKTNHRWSRDDISTFVPSPIAYRGRVYLVRDKGEVECVDPKTGNSLWSDRLPKHRTAYYASPLIAGDRLYAPREDGTIFVASIANDRFKLLSENDMGQPVIGSPVPANGKLLIRGQNELYCVKAQD